MDRHNETNQKASEMMQRRGGGELDQGRKMEMKTSWILNLKVE
jgi:hypothetical protein